MKQKLKALLAYPLILLFFGFLALYSAADLLAPDRAVSELENRPLTQMPAFNLASFIDNQWTREVGEYTKDQFLFRDGWIDLQGTLEVAQGKLELGGVWLAKDDYQIAKNSVFSTDQERLVALNTEAVCALAAAHPGKVTAMVVPSPANALSDELRWDPPQADENARLNDTFAQMEAAGANVVDLRETYSAHKNDTQLYYRTDHHWTTRGGASLAYEEFCRSRDREAVQPSDELLVMQQRFFGTNFAKTKRAVPANGDTLEYYDFPYPLTVHKAQADGSITEETGPLMDTEKLSTFDMYGAFLRGNNGYSVMEGEGKGKLLLVKDSYGNSFAPYLGQSYEKVGIIDLRAWHEVSETFAAGGYDEILVLYSFDNFTTDQNAVRMMA